MTIPIYTYRVVLTNLERVRAFKFTPASSGNSGGQGNLGLDETARASLKELTQASFDNKATEAQVRELGEKLFDVVFDQALAIDFLNFYNQVRADSGLIRFILDIDEQILPELQALPWEFMRVPARYNFNTFWLATSPVIVFSRRRDIWPVAAPVTLEPGEKLRIALVVSYPTAALPGQQPLRPVMYKPTLETINNLVAQNNQVELVEVVEVATRQNIDNALKKQPHILHFIGHGQFNHSVPDRPSGEIALVADQYSNTPKWTSAQSFGELLNSRYTPAVVLLSACEGATSDSAISFVSVASQLVQQNVPVVIAMQYEIPNWASQSFAAKFYEQLAQTGLVDSAVQEARYDLYNQDDQSRVFATPVLFMRVDNGQIFNRNEASSPPATGVAPEPVKEKEETPATSSSPKAEEATMPDDTSKATYNLTFPQKSKLTDLLLACPSFSQRAERDTVLAQVKEGRVMQGVARSPTDKMDIMAILARCVITPGALPELVEVIKAFDGEVEPVQKLDEFVRSLKPNA